MSSAPHHHGRRPPGAEQEVESSNSTANKFLGGTRKAWMLEGAPTRRQLPSESNAKRVPSSSLPLRTEKPSALSQPSRTPKIITGSDGSAAAPASPITPGHIVPKNESSSHSSALQNIPVVSTGSASALPSGMGPISVLPSPEPSNGSHNSLENSGPNGANGGVVDGHPARPDQAGAVTVVGPANSISPVPMSSRTSPANAQQTPSNRPVIHTPSLTQSLQTASFWRHAALRLNLYKKSPPACFLSETVELPRVRLLQDACRLEDLFYIALHQVYCIYSYAPSQLAILEQFSIERCHGFDIIQQLLVDNARLSGDFLKWCVNYPSPLLSMLATQDYQKILQLVGNSLSLISNHWISFEQELWVRSYPPLVRELVEIFGVTSPVLQTIIFTALTRRLYGSRNEQLMKACQTLFEADQQSFTSEAAVSADLADRHTAAHIKKYQDLSKRHLTKSPMPPPMQGPEAARASQSQIPSPHARTGLVNVAPVNSPATIQQQIRAHPTMPPSPYQRRDTHSSTPISPQPPGLQVHQTPSNRPPQQHPVPAQRHGIIQTRPSFNPAHPVGFPGTPTNPVFPGTIPVNQYVPYPEIYHAGPQFQGYMGFSPMTSNSPSMYPPSAFHGRRNSRHAPNPHSYYPPTSSGPIPPDMMPRRQPGYGSHQAVQNSAPALAAVIPSQPSRAMVGTSQHPATSLLPSPGEASPPLPTSRMDRLHQRESDFMRIKLVQLGTNEEASDLIQFMRDFALAPTALESELSSFQFTFTVPADSYSRRLRGAVQSDGCLVRLLSSGTLSYYLRCVQLTDPSVLRRDSTFWFHTECTWPNAIYVHVNSRELSVPRKFHCGKDLPLDITDFLKEGTNALSVNILRGAQEPRNTTHAVAVEVVDTSSIEAAKGLIRRLTAVNAREQIQKHLSMQTDDEDLVIVDDYITIDLIDPFTKKIFDTPARGQSCTHRECFDLDTYLRTIVVTPARCGNRAPPLRCPICRKDASPNNLLIDEFLVGVRGELERMQKLGNVRSIHVRADGSWMPMWEKDATQSTADAKTRNAVPAKRDRSTFEEDEPTVAKPEESHAMNLSRIPSAPEIIELD